MYLQRKQKTIYVVFEMTSGCQHWQCLVILLKCEFLCSESAAGRSTRSGGAVDLVSVSGCAPGLWNVQPGPGSSLSLQRLPSPA